MNKKHIPNEGVVFSTNPDFQYQYNTPGEQQTLDPARQNLKVLLDKRARAGKQVTLVDGFIGASADLDALGKRLKNLCGVGGSTKDCQVMIQGDFRQKIGDFLLKEGYRVKAG